jgi:hypothetical protein
MGFGPNVPQETIRDKKKSRIGAGPTSIVPAVSKGTGSEPDNQNK